MQNVQPIEGTIDKESTTKGAESAPHIGSVTFDTTQPIETSNSVAVTVHSGLEHETEAATEVAREAIELIHCVESAINATEEIVHPTAAAAAQTQTSTTVSKAVRTDGMKTETPSNRVGDNFVSTDSCAPGLSGAANEATFAIPPADVGSDQPEPNPKQFKRRPQRPSQFVTRLEHQKQEADERDRTGKDTREVMAKSQAELLQRVHQDKEKNAKLEREKKERKALIRAAHEFLEGQGFVIEPYVLHQIDRRFEHT
jgi:hypothetical protein